VRRLPTPGVLLGRVGLGPPAGSAAVAPPAAPVDFFGCAQAARDAALRRRGRRCVGSGASLVL
jgi:hypothetical protein